MGRGTEVNKVPSESSGACPVCGGALKQQRHPWWHVCPDCGMEVSTLPPRFDDRPMTEMFDWPQRQDALKDFRRQNFEQLLDHLARFCPPPARLLDVGSAEGWFLEAALARGYDVQGIEPDARMAQKGDERLNIRAGFFPDALSADERFEVITFNDVFEHLPDTTAALTASQRHLEEGGLLVINLPSAQGGLYRISQVLDRLGMPGPLDRMWQKDYPSPHLSYFCPDTLARLAEAHGFRERARESLPTVRASGLWSRIRYDRTKPWAYSAITWLGVIAVLPLLKALPPDISLQIFVRPPNGA